MPLADRLKGMKAAKAEREKKEREKAQKAHESKMGAAKNKNKINFRN